MRILLDENLDWRLRRHLPGHEVDSVTYIGWSGIKNGVLLRRAAEAGYDVLLTMDGNSVSAGFDRSWDCRDRLAGTHEPAGGHFAADARGIGFFACRSEGQGDLHRVRVGKRSWGSGRGTESQRIRGGSAVVTDRPLQFSRLPPAAEE